MSYRESVAASKCILRKLTRTRVIVDLCRNREVAVHFRTLTVDNYHSETRPLGLVLCECCIRVIGLEVLNLLEVRFLLYGAHSAVLELGLEWIRITFQKVK